MRSFASQKDQEQLSHHRRPRLAHRNQNRVLIQRPAQTGATKGTRNSLLQRLFGFLFRFLLSVGGASET